MNLRFYFLFAEPFRKLFQREAVLDADIAEACAAQGGEEGTAVECLTNVASQRTDISLSTISWRMNRLISPRCPSSVELL